MTRKTLTECCAETLDWLRASISTLPADDLDEMRRSMENAGALSSPLAELREDALAEIEAELASRALVGA